MYQAIVNHPANQVAQPLERATYDAMYEVFEQIARFWGNLPDPAAYRSRLEAFMDNRIRLHPEYAGYYVAAAATMSRLVQEQGKEAAYDTLFTDKAANQAPPQTPLALVRQKVSNEFIAFQVSQGGFKRYSGAINYPSFIAGAYIPGEHAPYRTPDQASQENQA